MGDEGGIGFLTGIISGLTQGAGVMGRAAQAARPVIQSGVTKGIRFADPRRLAPLVQQIQKGPLFRPIPIVEKTIAKTPIIKDLPEWARGALGIATSPAGIAGELAMDYLLAKAFKSLIAPRLANADPQQTATLGAKAPVTPPQGTPTPDLTGDPLVDAVTPRMSNRQAAPVQAPVVPQFTEASLQAANAGYEAPRNVPLSQFYGAQQALGQKLEQTGELQRRLRESGGASGMTDAALMAWAQKNPGLAYRELVNRESRAGIRPTAD
jgi:hypothetical protein